MKRMTCVILAMLLMMTGFSAMAEEMQESEWLNILFMGGDSRSTERYGLTDSMMIISVNQEEGLLKMTSIMRDTWVDYPELGKHQKINAANVYGGPELSIQTVNDHFDTDIEKYVMVNMSDLVDIVDLVGGIDLVISESERSYTNRSASDFVAHVRKYSGAKSLEHSGLVHMNGLLAVAYTRNRSTDNDYGRVMRQQKMLLALAEAMQNMEVNDLMDIVGEITERIDTNLENEEMKELAMTGLSIDIESVEQFRIPVDGTFESGMIDGTWKIVADFEENSRLLKEFIYSTENGEEEPTE